MFNRKKYKKFAKAQLKSRWGIPIIVSLIALFVDFIFQLPGIINVINSEELWMIANSSEITMDDFNTINNIVNNSTPMLASIIQSLVVVIFEIAALNVYLKMSMSPDPVSFSSFLEGLNNWGRAILAFLWKTLWLLLWSLIGAFTFFIPTVIKSIAYSQTFLLVAEYKELSIPKALKISMIITKGHKWELFVLDLSFLGWLILCSFTLGIGYIFLTPYMQMTYVNAYHALLGEAIESGKIKPEDLSE